MAINTERGSEFFQIFQEYWLFEKKFLAYEKKDDQFWEDLLSDAGVLSHKWPRYKSFVDQLLMAFINLCEKEAKDEN